MIFVLPGDIYPFTHTTQKQKWVDRRWRRYLGSKDYIKTQVHSQMVAKGWEMLPDQAPIAMATFLSARRFVGHKRDVSNINKALEDALQGVLFRNDAWIDHSTIHRTFGNSDLAIVAVELMRDLPNTVNPILDWLSTVMQIARQEGVYVI